MATPCVIVTSCTDFDAETLIKDILQCDKLTNGHAVIENIIGYDWKIDTKYYTADVLLCLTKKRTIGDQTFAESVQGFVVYFDPEKKASFDSVKLWSSYIEQIEPEVKILVCSKCGDNSAVNRLTAQTWCIDNGFELVELDPETYSDSETEDDFVETTGLKRIVQSLHAHTWPNLVFKDSRHTVSPYIRQLMQEQHDLHKSQADNEHNLATVAKSHNTDDTDQRTESTLNQCDDVNSEESICDNNNSETDKHSSNKDEENLSQTDTDTRLNARADNCNDCGDSEKSTYVQGEKKEPEGASGDASTKKRSSQKKQPSKEERLDSLLPSGDMDLFAALGTDDPEGESFEKLFEKFAQMKEKANSLPFPERKKYAENVAVAFWKAMGGDEDEIGDLDSDG